jgi:hypothetical protein
VANHGDTLVRGRKMLTTSPVPSGRQARLTGVVAVLSLILASLVTLPAQAAAPTWYQDHLYSTGATAATADKPQSKVWYNDGSWWALMIPAGGTTVNIHKLVNHTWTDTGTVVDTRVTSTGDALFSGSRLYVISRTSSTGAGAIRLYRFTYAGGVYTKDLTNQFGGAGSESATIDKDSDGRLWVTFTRGNVVYVTHSDVSQTTWVDPFRIAGADTDVAADDISAVIAFEGKIGVLWSDQASNAMRFAYHVDGAADSSWTLETVLSGTAIADDHINIKSLVGDRSGRIYAAVKTSKTVATDPIIYVVTRGVPNASGQASWTAAPTATVADKLTRPQLALDSTNKVVYIMQSTEGGGTVYYKSAPMSDKPAFSGSGKGSTFITWTGAKVNNVSTTKDPVTSTTGLVAIAADEFAHRYYHAEMALAGGTTTPPPPTTTTRQVILNPTGDTMVKQGSASTNYGTTTTLQDDKEDVSGNASTAIHSYLKFTVPALATGEKITAASLSLKATNGTTNGPAIWRTADWAEGTMTWSTGRPARSGTATVGNYGNVGVARVGASVSGVTTAGDVSFELAPEATDGMDFASKEVATTADRPQLILTVTKTS